MQNNNQSPLTEQRVRELILYYLRQEIGRRLEAETDTTLDELFDVTVPTPDDGDVLTYDSGSGEWVAEAPASGALELDDLLDVDAPTPSDGDSLVYDSGSGDWINSAIVSGGIQFEASNETPAGTIDGANDEFTLANAPDPVDSLLLFKNGVLQRAGSGNDFTISGDTITFEAGNIPLTGDILLAFYNDGTGTAFGSPVDDITIEDTGTVIQVKDDGISTAKIADDAVTTIKIDDDAVTTGKIVNDAVTTAKILNANVTTAKIANDAVDKDKLGILATKGDLITFSTEPVVQGVGTNGQVLMADSGVTNGIKWGDAAFGGTADWNPFRQWYFSQYQPGGTTVSTAGWGGPTATGTGSVVQDSTGFYNNLLSSGTTNSEAGWLPPSFSHTPRENSPVFYAVIKSGATLAAGVNVARTWIGMFSATPVASDTPSVHYAAFRYSPATDGTAFWRCVTDNASGTPTVTTTTVAVAADTRYEMKIDMTGSDVLFYIDGVLVATHTTTLPTASTTMSPVVRVRTLENVAKNIRIAKVYVERT